MLERGELDIGERCGRRGARSRIEERELAEDVAGAEDGQQILAAIGGAAADLHLSGEDEEDPVARLALFENDGAAPLGATGQALSQGSARLIRQARKDRHASQQVFHASQHASPDLDTPQFPR